MTEREAFAPRQTYADGRVLLDEVAGEPADVHAPRAELHARVPRPDAVRLPDRARPPAGRPAVADAPAVLDALPADLVAAVRAGGLAAHPQLQRRDRGVVSPRRSAPTTAPPSSATAGPTRSSSSGSPTAGCAPGSAAAPWCATRSPAGAAGSTRSPSSTSGRWTRTCASTWSTSTAPTGCRSTPASATATRSARTSWQLLNEVYEAHTVREPWQAGDLLLVDNIRTAHSREPYERAARGARRDGRPGAPGRLLADRRGERPMTAVGRAARSRRRSPCRRSR